MRTVTIEILEDGSAEVSATGVKGPGCKSLTRQIEEGLGKTTRDTKTREFSLPAGNAVRQGAGA